MQTYLLAANLFTLAALLLGLGSQAGQAHRGSRLLPLFLLVISRSLIFLIALVTPGWSALEHALEVFGTLCLVWTLLGSPADLAPPWNLLAWIGAAAGLLLSLLALIPLWPMPFQLASLAVAVFGAAMILAGSTRVHWTTLAAPLALAVANFLSLLNLNGVSWLASLLAYAFFVSALYWQNVQSIWGLVQVYHDRQAVADNRLQDTLLLNQERQRLLDLSETLSAVPNLSQSMEHLVQSLGRATRMDQVAVFMVDPREGGQAQLLAIYSPERPVHLGQLTGVTVELNACPPLLEAVTGQQRIILPEEDPAELQQLYAIWQEDRLGPTLVQPLAVQGRPVGVLVLGNPRTLRPMREADARLCRALAPQMAAMVEHRRRYLELETQAGMMALALQQETGSAMTVAGHTPVGPGEYPDILEVIGDGVVVSDKMGRVRLVNGAAERILGKSRQELLGQSIGTVYGVIDSREAVEDLAVAFSRRSQSLPTFIETDERAIQGRLLPWRNNQKEWLGIIAVFRDVTREVQADRARNEFIAALSRELRAPLTAVKGYSELITYGAMGSYSPEQLHIQRIIQKSADRMVAVLDNAIQISAQDRHKLLPRLEQVNVTKVINEVLREIGPLAQVRGLTLHRDIKTELPPVTADPRHLRRILDNLLANACQFTPRGGTVTLRAWMQTEQEGSRRGGSPVNRPYLLLAVTDNGVGIPASEFKHIFEPFYQVKNQNLEEQNGMGMGLAVVKELVELHQGRVWVESTEGQGSIFQVALPLTQE